MGGNGSGELGKLIGGFHGKLDQDAQDELAKLVSLWPDLEELRDERAFTTFDVAVAALLPKSGNVKLARTIRRDLEQRIDNQRLWRRLFSVLFGLAALGAILFGIVAICWIVLVNLLASCNQVLCVNPKAETGLIDHLDSTILLALPVLALGAFGGVTSILTRLDRIVAGQRPDPWVLGAVAFARPIIGMGFALLVYLILECKLIVVANISQPDGGYIALVLALAYIAGFSERFVPGVMSKLEQTIGHAPTLIGGSASEPGSANRKLATDLSRA
jgi:hypothetical protein